MYASAVMTALQNAGTEVIAICRPKSKLEEILHDNRIRCEYLPGSHPVSIRSVRTLRRIFEEVRADVIHVHFHSDIWSSSLALRKDRRRKLFLSIYMGVPSKKDPLHRMIYRRVTGVVSSSLELNARLPDLYPIPEERIHYVPYGRNVELYKADPQRRQSIRAGLGVVADEMLVGTMLRIDPGKGAMDFARSFLYLHKGDQSRTRFLIVGEPTRKSHSSPGESPYEEHCEAYDRQLEAYLIECGLERTILRTGFQDDTIGYLSAMDIFVFPSRDELYSLVMLDAMAMGLPIVAARAGGNIRQIQEGVSGLLYGVADSKDLAIQLTRYLREPDLRAAHGKAARRFVEENHSMKTTIDRMLDLYSGGL